MFSKTSSAATAIRLGEKAVNVDLTSKTVSFRYEPAQVTLERIEETLDDAGYTVAK